MRVFKSGCLWIVGLMAAGVLAYAGYLYSIDFLAADDCADAGGSFHFDRGECSFTENYTGEVPPLWPF
ncbi:hypothetical protein [Qipengyuania profunda]|jgi:hypothetical protein|uniref:hypothetical protein n=1 Tax=Qipengyuania profunda TaxID=3113984 RepID=UPI00275DE2FC|nr:hypothetical protein [Qipengyuania sp. HL-TH1]MDP7326629.1 hypothetical protein [Qipengyuania citrea]WPL57170.1 hypothetical protein SD421_01690 [Qipengyuania sp. HL-TH5]